VVNTRAWQLYGDGHGIDHTARPGLQSGHGQSQIGGTAKTPVFAQALRPRRTHAALGRHWGHDHGLVPGHQGKFSDHHIGRFGGGHHCPEFARNGLRHTAVWCIHYQQLGGGERLLQRLRCVIFRRQYLQRHSGALRLGHQLGQACG
jgi:hypothetical protein